jgi:hypothetical protein
MTGLKVRLRMNMEMLRQLIINKLQKKTVCEGIE